MRREYIRNASPIPATAAAVEAIRAHVAERLAKPKRPAGYVVHDALPRDPNGKLYKVRLTEDAHGLR